MWFHRRWSEIVLQWEKTLIVDYHAGKELYPTSMQQPIYRASNPSQRESLSEHQFGRRHHRNFKPIQYSNIWFHRRWSEIVLQREQTLIVVYHAGKELYPASMQQPIYRVHNTSQRGSLSEHQFGRRHHRNVTPIKYSNIWFHRRWSEIVLQR